MAGPPLPHPGRGGGEGGGSGGPSHSVVRNRRRVCVLPKSSSGVPWRGFRRALLKPLDSRESVRFFIYFFSLGRVLLNEGELREEGRVKERGEGAGRRRRE